MTRWEYLSVYWGTKYELDEPEHPDQWRYLSSVSAATNGQQVAVWRSIAPLDRSPWEQVSFIADKRSASPYNRDTASPIDFLGDMGWEMVSSRIDTAAVRTTDWLGFSLPTSQPINIAMMFKRPKA